MENEQLEKIHAHIRATNEKLDELELMGYRSGGWDSKTDKVLIVKPGKTEHENRIVGYMDRHLNVEWIYKVFNAAKEESEAKVFQKLTGWHMLWTSGGQYFKDDTYLVYRDASDLPNKMQKFAKAMEPLDGIPKIYHFPELNLDGTADELFLKAKSSYKYFVDPMSLEALSKIHEVLLSDEEHKNEQAFYVGVLMEIADGKAENKIGDFYSLPEVKLDILDSLRIGRCSIFLSPERDKTLLVELQDKDVLLELTDGDGDLIGRNTLSVEEFLHVDMKKFNDIVDALQKPNILEAVLADAEIRSGNTEFSYNGIDLELNYT